MLEKRIAPADHLKERARAEYGMILVARDAHWMIMTARKLPNNWLNTEKRGRERKERKPREVPARDMKSVGPEKRREVMQQAKKTHRTCIKRLESTKRKAVS